MEPAATRSVNAFVGSGAHDLIVGFRQGYETEIGEQNGLDDEHLVGDAGLVAHRLGADCRLTQLELLDGLGCESLDDGIDIAGVGEVLRRVSRREVLVHISDEALEIPVLRKVGHTGIANDPFECRLKAGDGLVAEIATGGDEVKRFSKARIFLQSRKKEFALAIGDGEDPHFPAR